MGIGVRKVFVKRKIKDSKDLFRKEELAYKLPESKNIFLRELVYYGLQNFENGVELPLYAMCTEALIKDQISLPTYPIFNEFARSIYSCNYALYEFEVIESEYTPTSYPLLYRGIKEITSQLASNFQKIGEELERLEEEYGVDPNYLENYLYQDYGKIKSGEKLPSDKDIDLLEQFFGRKIIKRWKFVEASIFHSICEQIMEGWKQNKKIKQFIEEKGIQTSSKFKLKIKSPKELLENSYLTCDQLVIALIEPSSLQEIVKKVGYLKTGHLPYVLRILSSYGIVKEGRKYELASKHAFQIAWSKLSKKIERYRKYVEVQRYKKHKNLTKISKLLNIPLETVKSWAGKIKPVPISYYTGELLYRRGVMTEKEFELFEEYGLIKK